MRTHILHMHKAQNSPGTPAGESRRTWRAYGPRQLARVGGGSAAARVARLREYHVCDQHAEGHAGTRSLHRAVPFPPHRDSRVFMVRPRSWVRKVLVNFLECPGGGIAPLLSMASNKAKQQKLSPNEPRAGGRANVFFRRFTLLLLRQRYVFVYVTLP